MTDPGLCRDAVCLWLKEAVEDCFSGAAIVGCAGVWAERAQRRAPASWGPGRWVWSSVGLYAILSFGFIVLDSAVRSYRHKAAFGDFLGGIPSDARANLASSFVNFPPSMLLALGISYLAVGRRDQPAADAREWSGRTFGVLVVVSSIAASMAYESGY